MNYTLGAPNLALPPTPILTVQTLTENGVTIEWQALNEFGSDLQQFQVFECHQPLRTISHLHMML